MEQELAEIIECFRSAQQSSLEAYDIKTLYSVVVTILQRATTFFESIENLSDEEYEDIVNDSFKSQLEILNTLFDEIDELAVYLESQMQSHTSGIPIPTHVPVSDRGQMIHEDWNDKKELIKEDIDENGNKKNDHQVELPVRREQAETISNAAPHDLDDPGSREEGSKMNRIVRTPASKPENGEKQLSNDSTDDSQSIVIVVTTQQLQDEDKLIAYGQRFVLVEWESKEKGYALVEDKDGRLSYIPQNYLKYEGEQYYQSPQSRLREPKPHQTSSLRPPSHGALSPSVLSPSALAAHYPDESETAFTPGDEFTVAEQFQGRHNYFSDENDNSVDWDVYKHGVHTAHYEIHPHQWRTRGHTLACAAGMNISKHGLYIADPTLDKAIDELHPLQTAISTVITILRIKGDLPVPGDHPVIHRHLRVTLFDGQNFLGNVLQLRSAPESKGKSWRFDRASSYFGAQDDENICLVRSSCMSPDLSLAFEFSAQVQIDEHTRFTRVVEIPCGWSRLSLYRENGQALQPATRTLQVFTGPIQIHEMRRASQGLAASFEVKVSTISKKARALCDRMPRNIVIQFSAAPLISLYRDVLAHNYKNERLKRGQKKDKAYIRSWLQIVFTQKMFPLLIMVHKANSFSGPHAIHAMDDPDVQNICHKFVQGDTVSALMYLTELQNAGVYFQPFDTRVVTFSPKMQMTE